MKKFLVVLVLLVGAAFFLAQGSAQATSFGFGDESICWPGWTDDYNNGTGSKPDYNVQDVVGTPDLTGGVVVTDDSGLLKSISIHYTSVGSDYSAGDLFIDLDSDAMWDYVVHNTYNHTSGHWYGIATSNLYSVAIAENSSSAYLLSNDTWNGGLNATGFRNDHPTVLASVTDLTSLGSVGVTDFDHSNSNGNAPGDVVFDFSGIAGTNWNWGNAIIGFAPTCANDVIYSQVPEPATMLLLGFSLLGLGVFSGKKLFVGKKG